MSADEKAQTQALTLFEHLDTDGSGFLTEFEIKVWCMGEEAFDANSYRKLMAIIDKGILFIYLSGCVFSVPDVAMCSSTVCICLLCGAAFSLYMCVTERRDMYECVCVF